MARLRIPSARLVFDLPQHDALGGKDAVWPCISLALPPPTPGRTNLGDFINFMVLLRSHVNALKPSEIITPGSTVHLVEKIRQLFPHLDLKEFPSLEPYAYLEPADLFHDYLEQEARKGK
ncbi:hypothetical protein TNCV_4616851 [Trichonephila clavipes]|nr:hypothetical protein TNCV_4616851 [Trichonephila clavipes]